MKKTNNKKVPYRVDVNKESFCEPVFHFEKKGEFHITFSIKECRVHDSKYGRFSSDELIILSEYLQQSNINTNNKLSNWESVLLLWNVMNDDCQIEKTEMTEFFKSLKGFNPSF